MLGLGVRVGQRQYSKYLTTAKEQALIYLSRQQDHAWPRGLLAVRHDAPAEAAYECPINTGFSGFSHILVTVAVSSYRIKRGRSCSTDQIPNRFCGVSLLSFCKREDDAVRRADGSQPEKRAQKSPLHLLPVRFGAE